MNIMTTSKVVEIDNTNECPGRSLLVASTPKDEGAKKKGGGETNRMTPIRGNVIERKIQSA